MSFEYGPSSEPLHIYIEQLFFDCSLSDDYEARGVFPLSVDQEIPRVERESSLLTTYWSESTSSLR
jgi:hypothetical protein